MGGCHNSDKKLTICSSTSNDKLVRASFLNHYALNRPVRHDRAVAHRKVSIHEDHTSRADAGAALKPNHIKSVHGRLERPVRDVEPRWRTRERRCFGIDASALAPNWSQIWKLPIGNTHNGSKSLTEHHAAKGSASISLTPRHASCCFPNASGTSRRRSMQGNHRPAPFRQRNKL